MKTRFAVGPTLRDLREARGASIPATACDAGLSYPQLQRMETHADNLDRWLTKLDALALALGLTLAELLNLSRLQAD